MEQVTAGSGSQTKELFVDLHKCTNFSETGVKEEKMSKYNTYFEIQCRKVEIKWSNFYRKWRIGFLTHNEGSGYGLAILKREKNLP